MSTIKEIARLAGVSRGTVDRVLNHRGGVNPKTAKKIHEIASQLDYSPNKLGKRLAVRKKQLAFGCVLFGEKRENPYFAAVASAMNLRSTQLAEYGIAVEIRYAAIGDAESLITQIDNLVALGINGLVITPVEHEAVVDKIARLHKAGIPVVTIDSDLSPSKRLAYVGSNSYAGGQTAGNLMALFTAGHAKTGILLGSRSVKNHTQRIEGFRDYIEKNQLDIEICAVAENHDDDGESYQLTETLLREHPGMNALFLAAAGVEGACRAVLEAGAERKMHIISFDTAPFTCEMLKKGVISATIGQQPEVQGKRALDILLDCLGMDMAPEKECHYTKTEIFIRANLPDADI